ncbi:MAG: hypothetical protein F6J87_07195 [Spirulina sp. SIO3F2]|nr:hypothetical protein [Spirulina sp. SIO3F2]
MLKLDNTTQTTPNTHPVSPKQHLYKYVAIYIGLGLLALATFPIAYWRVSQSSKYDAGPFNTLTPEQSQKSDFDTPP